MVSVEQAVAKYIHFLRVTGKKATAKTYGNHLRVWMTWLDGAGLATQDGLKLSRNSEMAAVNTVETVAAFYGCFKTCRKNDGATIHNNAARSFQHALRALWMYCFNQKMWAPDMMPLTSNACALVPMTAQVANHRDYATVEQVEALLDACYRLSSVREVALAYAVMQVLLTAGIRRNEMICLEVGDYDRTTRTLHIRVAKGGTPRKQK